MATYPEQILHLCQRVMQAVVYGFTQADVALPDKQLVFGGVQYPDDFDDPDADNPGSLAIGLVGITQGKPGNPQSAEQIPPLSWRYVTIQIELWRPASGLNMQDQTPSEEEMQVDAATFLTDASVLWGALEEARAAQPGDPNLIVGPHTPYSIGFVRPAAISGGSGGSVAQISIALTGDP